MKKIWILGFVFITVLFGAGTRTAPANIPASTVNTAADVNVVADPLVQKIIMARANGDQATYKMLIQEWQKQNLPFQNSKFPILQSHSANDKPTMSWADDKLIWAGNVNYSTWAAGAGLDDEAIDVDYVNGDTIRAVIACTDSSIRLYQSLDKGQTWSFWDQITGFGAPVFEPQIINQSAGWCHFFCRAGSNNGDLIALNFNPTHVFTYSYLDNTADTIANYSVCSDRVQYGTDCWLFVAYHKQLGGAGLDGIWFTRSFDHAQTWEAATQLQFGGSGFPDLSYGANDYLWSSYIYRPSGGLVNIQTRRSTNEGGNWQGSVVVMTDNSAKTTPKIAGSHSTQSNAWVVWGRQYTSTPYDWDVLASWTQDAGATWSSWVYNPGWINMHDVMPSISIFDNSGAYNVPYLSYILTADTLWNTPAIRTKYWHADSTWGPNGDEAVYNNFAPAFTGPVQCWENPGYPAIAYVGANGVNVYYDAWSNTGVEEGKNPVTTGNLLSPNQPNPFRVSTRFQYTVPEPGRVNIGVYNTIGQKVASLIDEDKNAGTYQASYNGSALPRGIYFLKFQCGKANMTRKLIVE